ncbi:MAG: hypothetical protein Tp138OMZ00d2C19078261_63 [Prokaryotic dsDNA virus sp.]|jgi:NlpC/P60 family putative phage cell wall peptidase|nr:MAG: hypothetical protein Tp138OMZ00d2C19078261_63 [Prokaryotic dsDNA virus sp.]|tara:strand:- start:10917 stop:11330 length:414 start_codon:yes stop_codon:yes gene_type:complete
MNERLNEIARSWIGTPYRHQMSKKGVGCDCLGLLTGCWREYYTGSDPEWVPPYSPTWGEHRRDDPFLAIAKRHMDGVSCLEQADVLIFRMRPSVAIKHVAVYTGNGTIIHAYSRHEVREEPYTRFWSSKMAGKFRFR